MSIYDKINTAKDLLTEVTIHGMSTNTEDICRAQDIFGHTAIEDLVALANDNGMNGSWSTGRRGTQSVFYQVAFAIWHWEDATRFYNEHTNPVFGMLKQQKDELKVQAEDLKARVSEIQEELGSKLQAEMEEHSATKKSLQEQVQNNEIGHKEVLAERVRANDAEAKVRKMEADIHDRDMQIMALKAKLYDMMMEKEGTK